MGLTNPTMAERPVISRATAQAPVSSILLFKPEISNRMETIAVAWQQIWLDDREKRRRL